MKKYLYGLQVDLQNQINYENEKVFIWIENEPLPIDKVVPIEGLPIEYKEIEFEGRKLLVSTLEYELKAREYLLQIPDYHKVEKVKKRIKQIKDYLNK